jgi:ABC-type nitrate/sulfonate/bicarbonate transport system substrate-binding protein
MCLTSVAHFLNAKHENPDVDARFVFMVARQSHMAAFVLDGRAGEHGRPITTHRDLDGASLIGERDASFTKEYLAFLSRIDAARGSLVPRQYAGVVPALIAGEGDVVADFVDLLPRFQATADASGVRIRALPFHEAGVDIYGSGLVCNGALIRDRPELVRTAVDAYREALMITRDDPAAGLERLLTQIPTAEPELVLAGWSAGASLIFDADEGELGAMDTDKWQRTIAFHADAYGVPRDTDPATVFDDTAFRTAGAAG